LAQQFENTQYPTTQYQGFGGGAFATTAPTTPDPGSASNQVSMSPDSWGAPATQAGDLAEFQPRSTNSSTPSVPDLNGGQSFAGDDRFNDSGNFQRASIYGSQPIPLPNSARYPLGQESGKTGSESEQNSVSNLQADPAAPANNLIGTSEGESFHSIDGWYEPTQQIDAGFHRDVRNNNPGCSTCDVPFINNQPNYRPDLGHRQPIPTSRHAAYLDRGEQFDFENKKKEYPPMSEILATGRYFGSASALYLKPHFQGNTAITASGPGVGESTPFDFDYEAAPRFRLGFESKFGPGIELNYWQFDETSNVSSFVSDGTISGTTSAWMLGPSQWSRLEAVNAGERIDAAHTIDIESIGASFFKEVKFKVSRINGMFGIQYASIAQTLDATLTDSGGSEIGRLNSRSDLRAYGPKFAMEYYRPVGHTKLEFVTAVGGSVMFGQRDQFIQNTATGDVSRIGADEFVTTIDFLSGVQYKKMTAENRAYYAQLGMVYQTWIGGGTANDPQGDFGVRGISFAVGYNR